MRKFTKDINTLVITKQRTMTIAGLKREPENSTTNKRQSAMRMVLQTAGLTATKADQQR